MLYALYPFFVAFWLQLDKQPPSKLTILRIIIAGISAFLLTRADTGNIDLVGVVCMLLIAMSCIVIPAYFIFDRSWPAANPPWAPVLALTAVTFVSRLLLFLGVKHIGGMQTALLGLGELLVAIIFSHLLLGEILTTLQWMGTVGLGVSLLLVRFEKPPDHPIHTHGLLSWVQPPEFPADFYKH
jgi:drug/metabolite transporter (DMT)-like permease